MHEGRETHPAPHVTGLIAASESFSFPVIIADLKGPVHEAVEVHGFFHYLADSQCFALMYKVLSAELFRRQLQSAGDLIHVPLQREDALWSSKSAERPVRRMIRGNCLAANTDIGTEIGACSMD